MSMILSAKINTLRFTDQFEGISLDTYCDVEITVYHRLHDNDRETYDIQYKCTYSHSTPLCKTLNPFFGGWDGGASSSDCRHGDTISANEMTEKMVEYLLMDFEELAKYSGNKSALSYKISLMRGITFLWD